MGNSAVIRRIRDGSLLLKIVLGILTAFIIIAIAIAILTCHLKKKADANKSSKNDIETNNLAV